MERRFATFEADFPDDATWSASGDIVTPTGRNVCAALASAFEDCGFEVSKLYQHEDYGWEFTANKDKEKYMFLLQYAEPWLLIAEDRSGLFDKLRRPSRLVDALRAVTVNLNRDSRFKRVRWYTRAEYEQGCLPGTGGLP